MTSTLVLSPAARRHINSVSRAPTAEISPSIYSLSTFAKICNIVSGVGALVVAARYQDFAPLNSKDSYSRHSLITHATARALLFSPRLARGSSRHSDFWWANPHFCAQFAGLFWHMFVLFYAILGPVTSLFLHLRHPPQS